ncbi:MAG TPA: response regulator [Candidatus Paceibacterota bacterium]|nr:response regulator [Candidatus Paceibacterota bacterium]
MQSRAKDGGGDSRPVLVVDDNADARGNLRDMLEDLGQCVVEAGDGQEALDFLLSSPAVHVQLILLDLDMPRMTGWDLLRLLKSYSRFSGIPVLIVSRYLSSFGAKDRAVVDGCIEAPTELAKLRAMVQAFVEH